MARFRNKKAAQLQNMQLEHHRLEQVLEQHVSALGRIGSWDGVSQVQRLVLEREVLREEDVFLHQEITQRQKFQQVIQRFELPSYSSDDTGAVYNVTVRYVESEWKPVKEQAGRWIEFQRGEPSFFFHPFSRQAFDSIFVRLEDEFIGDTSNLNFAGKFLGWEVFHAPLTKSPVNSMLGHARYSKVLQCSVDAVQKAMTRADGINEWPILPSSRNLGLTEDIAIQTLQRFDDDSQVIVRCYPGKVNIRYLGLVKFSQLKHIDGKRALMYSFAIADSVENARSRNAEPDQQTVRWIDEGGAFLTLTEVGDTTVHVEFNHWAGCKSKLQAQNHFITFGHIVTRWEQLVAPSKLLSFE